MPKTKDFSELMKIKKIMYDAAEEFAQEVLLQIENQYETVIDKFYADYTPVYYKRTEYTYDASSGSRDLYSPENFIHDEQGYDVGINVDSKNIPGNPYRASTDWVFTRTFSFGIHGLDKRNYWGQNNTKTYKRTKGAFIGSIKTHESTMSNMTPSPSVLMNLWWKKFNTNKNLDRIYHNILDSKLG